MLRSDFSSPVRCARERAEQVAFDPRQDRLRLRVAEAAVELEHARAIVGEHQAGVEQARERRASLAPAPRARVGARSRAARSTSGSPSPGRASTTPSRRCSAPCPVADALEVLRRRKRDRAVAVGEGEERDLLALEQLFDQDVAAERGRPARPASSSSCVRQTKTPLPAASPSAFTTQGTGRRRDGPPSGRLLPQDVFRESLGALDAGGGGSRPEYRDPCAPERVGEADHQRRFRPDDDQVDVELAAEGQRPSPSSALTGWHSPSAAMPGFPGAACSASKPGLWLSFHASACSRPPEPTRSTFTARESTRGVGASSPGARAGPALRASPATARARARRPCRRATPAPRARARRTRRSAARSSGSAPSSVISSSGSSQPGSDS